MRTKVTGEHVRLSVLGFELAIRGELGDSNTDHLELLHKSASWDFEAAAELHRRNEWRNKWLKAAVLLQLLGVVLLGCSILVFLLVAR